MDVVFEEKQYLGYNKFNLFIRSIIAITCFGIYFFGNQKEQTNTIFLVVGITIMVLSLMAFFVLHIKTQIIESNLVLTGFWTARKVKINLTQIVKAERVKYSKILFNRPVYNLHLRGKIKFFTHGNWAVELTDKEGLKYRIGSQRVEELLKKIEGNKK